MLRSAWALQISAVSFLPLVAVAQEVGCRPYRVVYVGDLSSYPLADTELDEGRDRLFPRGDLRFHLSADRVISGTVMTRGMIAATDLSCSPDGAGGMVDGDDYGILLSQWTGDDGVVSINWGCSGHWDEVVVLDAAGGAATMLGFDGLGAMADYAASAPPVEALGITELGAVITQSILGGEP
jgi:hypothetical protein